MSARGVKKAAERYDGHRKAVAVLLKEIKEGLAQHVRDGKAQGLNYGDVGDIAHYREQLQDIADSLLKRGEYAPENVYRGGKR